MEETKRELIAHKEVLALLGITPGKLWRETHRANGTIIKIRRPDSSQHLYDKESVLAYKQQMREFEAQYMVRKNAKKA